MCATHTNEAGRNEALAGAPARSDALWRTIRVRQTIDRIASAPGLNGLFAQADDRLYEIQESTLNALRSDGDPLDLDRAAGCRRLAGEIEDGWTIEPRSSSLLIIRHGAIEMLSFRSAGAFRRIAAPPFGELIQARMTPDGSRLLCTTCDESDPDLLRYEVHLVDAGQRSLHAPALLKTSLAPTTTWSPDARAFLAFDPCSEQLWQIGPNANTAMPVDLSRAGSRAIRAFRAHPTERWLMMELFDSQTSSS